MPQEFELRLVNELPATADELWQAVATGPGNLGWLYRMDIEPWEGGVVSRGPCTVAVWDPPRRFTCHRDTDDGFSLDLTYLIEEGEAQTSSLRTILRWVQLGEVDSGWDAKTEAATEYGRFFHHNLEQYLQYFKGRTATYIEAQGPDGSTGDNAFCVLRRGLGLADDVAEGTAVNLALPGVDMADAVVDYLTPHFVGLRTSDSLYQFFGSNKWGWPVWLSLHIFADSVDHDRTKDAWTSWLDDLFASPSQSGG